MAWLIKIEIISELKRKGHPPIQLRKIKSTKNGITTTKYEFRANNETLRCSEYEARRLFTRKVREVL